MYVGRKLVEGEFFVNLEKIFMAKAWTWARFYHYILKLEDRNFEIHKNPQILKNFLSKISGHWYRVITYTNTCIRTCHITQNFDGGRILMDWLNFDREILTDSLLKNL